MTMFAKLNLYSELLCNEENVHAGFLSIILEA